jgi:hypothetical protein
MVNLLSKGGGLSRIAAGTPSEKPGALAGKSLLG